MDALKKLVLPLERTNALQDTLKLVVIGGTVETVRKVSVAAWKGFMDSFFRTAHFNQDEYEYDCIMHWLSKQPAWARSREFGITPRSVERGGITQKTAGDIEDEEEDDDERLVHRRRKRRVSFKPNIDTTHTIYYRGHWLRITRTKRYPDDIHGCAIKISVVARSNDILKKLVLEAMREYEKDAEHRAHIFLADIRWRWNGARPKRPMSSIVLQPGIKGIRLADCKDFLASELGYAESGMNGAENGIEDHVNLPIVPGPIPYDAVAGELGHPHQGQSDGQHRRAPQRPSAHYGDLRSLGERSLKENHPSTADYQFRTQYQDLLDPWDPTATVSGIKISEQPGFVNSVENAILERRVALRFIDSPDAPMAASSAVEDVIKREQTIRKGEGDLKDRVKELEKRRAEIESIEEGALRLAEEMRQKSVEIRRQEEELMKREELFERREAEGREEERQQLVRQQAGQRQRGRQRQFDQYLLLLLLILLLLPIFLFSEPSPSSFSSSSSQRKDIYVYDTN